MALETNNPEVWRWIALSAAAVCAFLLRHLHGRINDAANKKDLAEAVTLVNAQRREDQERQEQWRRERRDTESEIFKRLGKQDNILSRIDERTARLVNDRNTTL